MGARLRQDVHVNRVYTFGKPRVGNQAYVNTYVRAAAMRGVSTPMWRLVGSLDPIPHYPPHSMGYVHEPNEVFYDSSQSYRVCPSPYQIQNNSVSDYPVFENTSCSYQAPIVL